MDGYVSLVIGGSLPAFALATIYIARRAYVVFKSEGRGRSYLTEELLYHAGAWSFLACALLLLDAGLWSGSLSEPAAYVTDGVLIAIGIFALLTLGLVTAAWTMTNIRRVDERIRWDRAMDELESWQVSREYSVLSH